MIKLHWFTQVHLDQQEKLLECLIALKNDIQVRREPKSGLVVVNAGIDNKYEFKMILDTGATNTTLIVMPYIYWGMI